MTSTRTLVGRARQALPEPAVDATRSVVRAWGMATAGLRLLPSIVIVGAQRAGTTTLFRLFSDHPSVLRATLSKGVGYFDLSYHRGPRWYRAHFPLRRPSRTPYVTFESSGYYSFHPLAIDRLAADLPDAHVVYMVRNPVDRAYSAHRHELARGFETEEFARAIELEPERLAGEVDKILADPRYESLHHRHHAYLARSRYSEQVARMHAALGPDRVHVVDADAFFAAPQEVFADLQRAVGLPVWTPASVEQWNARARDPLDPVLRAELMDHFAPYDDELSRLTGRAPSWR
ncbi:sulfotransferase [Cellulomonas sp.]|uniref:sulfotransferase family protein n=1 Tax=Cellulomonas sp. TaxID=40001 RepID=UPI00258939F6|nr:sulfotransferase [Cellulomonas sp.]MCR6688018.1 sulfotransferase [Cellulomonas sp.]